MQKKHLELNKYYMLYGTYRDSHVVKILKITPEYLVVEHETGKREHWNLTSPDDATPMIPLDERKIQSTLRTLHTRKKTVEQKIHVYEAASNQLYPNMGVKIHHG